MRKINEGLGEKCTDIRVEGRRAVGRPIRCMVIECGSGYGRTRDLTEKTSIPGRNGDGIL